MKMKKMFLLYFFISMSIACNSQTNFKSEQKKYERVRNAYASSEDSLLSYEKKFKINTLTNKVIIIAYKQEKKLEVWIKPIDSLKYSFFIEYDFCVLSGKLGPKREEGDGQVPEGFYYINRFNPTSSYYLSLGINYPNASDKILGNKDALGGDIFIHGSCVSIGCIPITDEKIMELYVLCVEAKNGGQENIPVYIFPNKLTDNNFKILKQDFKDNQELINFWENLKVGFDKFQKTKNNLNYTINDDGIYIFK